MTSASDTSHRTARTPPPESVRKLTTLLLSRQELATRKGVLEELLSKCGRPLSSPTTISTVLTSPTSSRSRTRSASTSPWSTYPPRSSSLETSISLFSSTPCPWKDDSFQHSRKGTERNSEATSGQLPQRKPSPPRIGQTLTVHGGQGVNSAGQANKVLPLSPDPLNPRPRPKRSGIQPHHRERAAPATLNFSPETGIEMLKPYHRERAMVATLNTYQETEMEMLMVDVEIELVLMQEWMFRLAERRKRSKVMSRAQVEGKKGKGGPVHRKQVEEVRILEERGNFF